MIQFTLPSQKVFFSLCPVPSLPPPTWALLMRVFGFFFAFMLLLLLFLIREHHWNRTSSFSNFYFSSISFWVKPNTEMCAMPPLGPTQKFKHYFLTEMVFQMVFRASAYPQIPIYAKRHLKYLTLNIIQNDVSDTCIIYEKF